VIAIDMQTLKTTEKMQGELCVDKVAIFIGESDKFLGISIWDNEFLDFDLVPIQMDGIVKRMKHYPLSFFK